jgi:hypothetical protein
MKIFELSNGRFSSSSNWNQNESPPWHAWKRNRRFSLYRDHCQCSPSTFYGTEIFIRQNFEEKHNLPFYESGHRFTAKVGS